MMKNRVRIAAMNHGSNQFQDVANLQAKIFL